MYGLIFRVATSCSAVEDSTVLLPPRKFPAAKGTTNLNLSCFFGRDDYTFLLMLLPLLFLISCRHFCRAGSTAQMRKSNLDNFR